MLINDDCLVALKAMPENSIDSLITDPPAGISFMGKEWDKGNNFIPAMTEIFTECLRVMKPGAHGLVWALPRTSHWTATALENAGFEIRDIVTHLFGSGFPKSHDISKGIDKAAGAEREVVGIKPGHEKYAGKEKNGSQLWERPSLNDPEWQIKYHQQTAPSTDEAKQWQGWGTALKPASEHWILVRKKCSEKTVAANVLKWNTGGINIDSCRIGTESVPQKRKLGNSNSLNYKENGGAKYENLPWEYQSGRFPANLVLDEEAAQMLDEQSGELGRSAGGNSKNVGNKVYGRYEDDLDRKPCGFGDKGGASRFFYVAKASKKDRNEGLEGMPEKKRSGSFTEFPQGGITAGKTKEQHGANPSANHHPTVKSTKLMEYLITLITPPKGIILDPFMGSGSTCKAAKNLGFEFIGIEKEKEYFEIAEKRIG